jgi:hypothetical protein
MKPSDVNPAAWVVIAIKPRGGRSVVGRCRTIEEAESQAAKHRTFVGVTGARILVERDDGGPRCDA